MKSNRDDFTKQIKELLAKRVGYRCSNPNCRKLTCGANDDTQAFTNIGVAAHITAAAMGGPRYDASLTPGKRKGYNNGIWLCQSCAKLIDSDELHYPVSLLHRWKKSAEKSTATELETSSSAQTAGLAQTAPKTLKEVFLSQVNAFPPIPRYKQIFYFPKDTYNSICKIADSIWEKCGQAYTLFLVDGKIYKLSLTTAYSEQLDFNNVEGFKLSGSNLFLFCEKKLIKYDLLTESKLKVVQLESFTRLIKILIGKDMYVVTNKLIFALDIDTLSVLKIYSIEDIVKQNLGNKIDYLNITDAVINCDELILSFANLSTREENGKIFISLNAGTKENYIFSFNFTTEAVKPFMQDYDTARFTNTSKTRIGEDGHNYFFLKNNRLVSYYDNLLFIWDMHDKLLISTIDIHIHEHGIEALAVYEDFIVTGGFSGELKVWDCKSKRCMFTFLDHSKGITDLKLIGHLLFSTSSDGLIIKWDMDRIIQSEAFTPNITAAKWDNEMVDWHSNTILANFESGYLELLDSNFNLIRNLYYIGKEEKKITFFLSEDILYFDIFGCKELLKSALVKYDLNRNISKMIVHELVVSKMLCFSDTLILSGLLRGDIIITNKNLDSLTCMPVHKDGILDMSQNENFIATIAMDNRVRLWNKIDFSLFAELEGWGAVCLWDKFFAFSTIKHELKLYSFNETLKTLEYIRTVDTNQEIIEGIIKYDKLILTYDKNSITFWDHQLNRLGGKRFDRYIHHVILKNDILTIDHGLNRDKEIFKFGYLYS